jgi:hypothetical protein
MAFASEIAEGALVACGRFCCLCHKFCGNNIETHHIKQTADDSYDNCIPLCFDCHAEVGSYNSEHPKGRKFTASELKGHRDRWYRLVEEGKHFDAGKSLPSERVYLKSEVKYVASEELPVVSLELVNSGGCALNIKKVSLGWRFFEEPKVAHSLVYFVSAEDWKQALPPGMSREYQAPIGPVLIPRGRKSLHFDDVWISAEAPKGEIQRMVGLEGLFLSLSLLLPCVSIQGTGRHVYPI